MSASNSSCSVLECHPSTTYKYISIFKTTYLFHIRRNQILTHSSKLWHISGRLLPNYTFQFIVSFSLKILALLTSAIFKSSKEFIAIGIHSWTWTAFSWECSLSICLVSEEKTHLFLSGKLRNQRQLKRQIMERADKVGLEGKECARLFSAFSDSSSSFYPKTTTRVFMENYVPLFLCGRNKTQWSEFFPKKKTKKYIFFFFDKMSF